MAGIKIGLLPLYLQFYREAAPNCTDKAVSFAALMAGQLKRLGADVVTAPICAVASEFEAAVKGFEAKGVDTIVTLHLAYSPSLEAIEALTKTKLPIVMLDTTPDFEYPADHATLMYNHGIHGVQDLANLLRRRGKGYIIEAGHWHESTVLKRALEAAAAAKCVMNLRRARVGRIGGDFKGMGDFIISPVALEKLGVTVVNFEASRHLSIPADREVAAELENWNWPGKMVNDSFKASAASSLIVRKFLEKESLGSFTFNFMDAHECGLPTTPFMEACLAMARQVGYAGEGDVLDAAWVGALLSVYPRTTFTEMFCPDWKRGRLYLSHMGEANISLLGNPSLISTESGYLPTPKPVVCAGGFLPGQVTLANLAPGPEDRLELITTKAELIPVQGTENKRISGLLRPSKMLVDFLREFSEYGGTHHSALCYDVPDSFWSNVSRLLGIRHNVI